MNEFEQCISEWADQVAERDKAIATLQATLAERVAEVGELNVQLRDARQDAARLREAAHNLTCAVCKMDMQRALKGA